MQKLSIKVQSGFGTRSATEYGWISYGKINRKYRKTIFLYNLTGRNTVHNNRKCRDMLLALGTFRSCASGDAMFYKKISTSSPFR